MRTDEKPRKNYDFHYEHDVDINGEDEKQVVAGWVYITIKPKTAPEQVMCVIRER
jgi:hypothetical protein